MVPLKNQQAPAIDAEVLAKLRHMGKNGDLLKRLVAIYFENATPLMEQLRAAVGNCHGNSMRQLAHSLKSSSGNVGALRLAALCAELETIGPSGALNQAEAVFEQIEIEYQRVRDALRFEKHKKVIGH
jgi:HPt (histidine-containing phosphotransfer) domain-containing protein